MEILNLKEVNYVVSDAIIANLLGRQNFNNAQSAVLELIKNAYDAAASVVELSFFDNSLIISDDGNGMDEKSFNDYWLHVGVSGKGYSIESLSGEKRITAGEKGIGRFALARLGTEVEMYSYMANGNGIHWKTDWVKNGYEPVFDNEKHGTTIIISGLRDKWNSSKIDNLKDYLGLVCNQHDMTILLSHNGTNVPVEFYYREPKIGENYVTEIHLAFNADSKELFVRIKSEEFDDIAKQYCLDVDLHNHERKIDVSKEIKDIEENMIRDVGSFEGSLFFSLKLSAGDGEKSKFCYKYDKLNNRFSKKVSLYRNAFSISGYDGYKDWLDLNSRVRKSPAAATHESGSWRVRDTQLSGFIQIDKHENCHINDLSNRQAIEETIYFETFKRIIYCGIVEFERYRQNIIKRINIKNKPTEIFSSNLMDGIASGKLSLGDLDGNMFSALRGEILENKIIISNLEQIKENQAYNIRLMNTLSTIGLKASALAHDMYNSSVNIGTFPNNLIAALKAHGFWGKLCADKGPSYYNVPSLIEDLGESTRKMAAFIDVVVSDMQKDKFIKPLANLRAFMERMGQNWMHDYGNLSIKYSLPEENSFKLSSDIFQTIFDNLLLNSVQQNDGDVAVNIEIKYDALTNEISVRYEDDGIGLDPKYEKDPKRILEVHETTRENGHGLGMWIVNDTIQSTHGKIESISTGPHFIICFSLGGC